MEAYGSHFFASLFHRSLGRVFCLIEPCIALQEGNIFEVEDVLPVQGEGQIHLGGLRAYAWEPDKFLQRGLVCHGGKPREIKDSCQNRRSRVFRVSHLGCGSSGASHLFHGKRVNRLGGHLTLTERLKTTKQFVACFDGQYLFDNLVDQERKRIVRMRLVGDGTYHTDYLS